MRLAIFSLAFLLSPVPLYVAPWSVAFAEPSADTTAPPQAQIDRGEKLYLKCRSCHNLDIPTNKLGPHLQNIINRKAGSVPDFSYSTAMRAAGEQGLIWDEATLKQFIISPKAMLPGTSMRFWGLWEAQADDLVSYLKSKSAK